MLASSPTHINAADRGVMDQHDDPRFEPARFVPDAYDRPTAQRKADLINPLRRRWRGPAIVATVAAAGALCLFDGSAAYAARPTKTADIAVSTPLTQIKPADGTDHGGVHGAFNLYDGAGGALEFWFDPSTGSLTVAVGAGVGEGGGGVLGTYAPGTPPQPGTYVYANANLGEGTVATVNVGGTYSMDNGEMVGTLSTTIEGRTLTIASDGGASFDAEVIASANATGFTGGTGIENVYNFNVNDVVTYIWHAVSDSYTGDYSLEDDLDSGDDTYLYDDDSSTDSSGGDLTTTDGSDSSSSSDDSGGTSDDGTGDGGDGGDGGCAVSLHELPDSSSAAKTHTNTAQANAVRPNLTDQDDDDGGDDGC